MAKKPKSDTTAGALAAARESDRTGATAPRDVPGADQLDVHGLRVYDLLFRARADWPIADLMLAVEAASTAQTIRRLRQFTSLPGCEVLVSSTGVAKLNPAITAIAEHQRQLAGLLRDLGIRLRDGQAKNVPVAKPADHLPGPTADATAGPSFTDWLASVDAGSPQ